MDDLREVIDMARIVVASVGFLLLAVAASAQDVPFDHFRTSFPLIGAHERITCESCHRGGVFRGTPTRCFTCHDGGGAGTADTARDVHHIRTTNDCDNCHLMMAWIPSRVDHDSVLGDCVSCHDGRTAIGKDPGHPPSSNSCAECHNTINFDSASFDHTGITTGCVTCHNGSTATGKHLGHPPSSNNCEECHNTFNWFSTGFNHVGITNNCFSCHNGTTAQGKSGGHMPTSNVCEACHRPGSWTFITFDHGQVQASCSTCHDDMTAIGKPIGHFQTSLQCDVCHRVQAWRPDTFRHTSPMYPGDHSGPPLCTACHTGNSAAVAWPIPGYQPDCASCHAQRFVPDSHKKVDSPTILYTVGELRDCAGACHLYTDPTFTTIQENRVGHHRPSDGGW